MGVRTCKSDCGEITNAVFFVFIGLVSQTDLGTFTFPAKKPKNVRTGTFNPEEVLRSIIFPRGKN